VKRFTHSLAMKLFVIILFLSLGITILVGLFTSFVEYRRTVAAIGNELEEIFRTNAGSLEAELWVMERRTIQIHLNGILNRPYMEQAAIHQAELVIASAGAITSTRTMQRRFPLSYTYNRQEVPLGVLTLTAGLDPVDEDLLGTMLRRFGYAGIMIFLVSLLIFFIVHLLMTGHLGTIAGYVAKLEPLAAREQLVLRRRFFRNTEDELDRVVEAINTLDKNLQSSFRAMEHEIAARRESEARYRELFDAMGSGVAVYEATGDGGDFIFKDLNRAGERMTRTGKEAVVGGSVRECFPGVNETGLFEVFQNVWRTGAPATHAVTLYKDEQLESWFENYVYRLPSGELVAMFEDVTDRKRLEEELARHRDHLEEQVKKRTAELEAAYRELETFSYSVSHDLRAPLRSIGGFAEIIARRHREALNEEGRHYFDNIVQAAAQMERLIADLLAYARLGRKSMRPRPVALGEILTGVTAGLADRIETTGARIEIAPEPPEILGDETLVKQVFVNLLDNAMTFRAEGVTPRIKISWQNKEGHVVVSVADNGIGIPAEHHETVFNVFQRLHGDQEYPGTGIGLSIVRKAVAMMGGRVWVESVAGDGSVFKVELLGDRG